MTSPTGFNAPRSPGSLFADFTFEYKSSQESRIHAVMTDFIGNLGYNWQVNKEQRSGSGTPQAEQPYKAALEKPASSALKPLRLKKKTHRQQVMPRKSFPTPVRSAHDIHQQYALIINTLAARNVELAVAQVRNLIPTIEEGQRWFYTYSLCLAFNNIGCYESLRPHVNESWNPPPTLGPCQTPEGTLVALEKRFANAPLCKKEAAAFERLSRVNLNTAMVAFGLVVPDVATWQRFAAALENVWPAQITTLSMQEALSCIVYKLLHDCTHAPDEVQQAEAQRMLERALNTVRLAVVARELAKARYQLGHIEGLVCTAMNAGVVILGLHCLFYPEEGTPPVWRRLNGGNVCDPNHVMSGPAAMSWEHPQTLSAAQWSFMKFFFRPTDLSAAPDPKTYSISPQMPTWS